MNANKKIGKLIKELRLSRNITLEKLAFESDFSKGGLSEIERGLRQIRFSSLEKICSTLNIKLSEFFKLYEDLK
ncbi:transcriptional regulator [Candidatus Gastranaerophilales bacterium]|nr:MAG: transcriptional regulator [Candidatus Gastranaerophilales bacterium]